MTRSLRLPAFRRLLAAYVINELAWAVGTLALSVLVYRKTGSAIGSSAFFICSMVAPALLSPALAARLDHSSPRVVLPGLYAVEAALFAGLAWTTHHFALGAVLALTLADGAVATTARALASATRTEILKPRDLLHEGNAVTNVGFSIMFMAGPLIGGLVVVAGGTVTALLVNCGLFALMAVVLSATSLPQARPQPGSVTVRLRAGLAHTRVDPLLGRLLLMQALGLVCFTVTVPIEVVYAQHTLSAGAGGYGALLGVWGAGAIAGSAAFARWRRRPPATLIAAAAAALGMGFAVMSVAPSLAVALAGATLAGAGNSVEWVAARTAIQQRTPDRWMTLMMSLTESISLLAPGIGILLGGVITALSNPRVAFAVSAAGSLLFAAAVPFVFRRGLPAPTPESGPADISSEVEATAQRGKSLV